MLSFKVLFFVSCSVMLTQALVGIDPVYDYSPQPLTGKELEDATQDLIASLSKLKGAKYTLKKIDTVIRTDKIGDLYSYNADLVDGNNEVKECDVGVWYRKKRHEPNEKMVYVECKGAVPVFEPQTP